MSTGTSNSGAQAGRLPVMKTYKLYIGGAFPRSESGRSERVTDAKGEFVANLARASRKDFRNAVVAARKAQAGWAGRTAFNRAQILYRMAEMIESRAASLAEALAGDGRTLDAARAEVNAAIDRLVQWAGWPDKLAQVFGGVNPVAAPYFDFTAPEAMGVVGVIAPIEAPLLGLIDAIAPVIAPGNTVVVIVDGPARHMAIELAEVLHTSDLPGGVVNLLTGRRDELLPWLGEHRDVDAVSAHGLTAEQGKALQETAADSVKRVTLTDDRDMATIQAESGASPYRITPFLEMKTVWHPTKV